MVLCRIVGKPSVLLLGKFRRTAAPGKEVTLFVKHFNRRPTVLPAGVAKRFRRRDAVFREAPFHVLHFGKDLLFREPGKVRVVPGVVADFKTGFGQLANFVPGQKRFLVLEEAKAFANEKGRPEAMAFQQRRHEGEVGFISVVESQNNQLVGNRQLLCPPC